MTGIQCASNFYPVLPDTAFIYCLDSQNNRTNDITECSNLGETSATVNALKLGDTFHALESSYMDATDQVRIEIANETAATYLYIDASEMYTLGNALAVSIPYLFSKHVNAIDVKFTHLSTKTVRFKHVNMQLQTEVESFTTQSRYSLKEGLHNKTAASSQCALPRLETRQDIITLLKFMQVMSYDAPLDFTSVWVDLESMNGIWHWPATNAGFAARQSEHDKASIPGVFSNWDYERSANFHACALVDIVTSEYYSADCTRTEKVACMTLSVYREFVCSDTSDCEEYRKLSFTQFFSDMSLRSDAGVPSAFESKPQNPNKTRHPRPET